MVIGETCDIGDHVKIYQGVTLGALSFPKDGDGKLIRGTQAASDDRRARRHLRQRHRAGRATVIGHDSVIGSSVWLTRSVAPGTTVVLEEAAKLRIRAESPDELTRRRTTRSDGDLTCRGVQRLSALDFCYSGYGDPAENNSEVSSPRKVTITPT